MTDGPAKDPRNGDAKSPDMSQDEKQRTFDRYDYGGNGRKWLIGVAAAAVLLGGGYLVVKNWPQGGRTVETASVKTAYDADAPAYVAPPPSSANAQAGPTESAALSTAAPSTTAATAPPDTPERTKARPRRATPAAAVPEEIVGVTPASVVASDSDNEVVITANRRPVWVRTPNARRLSALYPARALERGREGEASLRCTVEANGALDCVRAGEYPAHAGFGTAALRVASRYRHAPTRWDGTAAAGTPVNLRVVFRIEDDGRRRT
jgi:protein TonB